MVLTESRRVQAQQARKEWMMNDFSYLRRYRGKLKAILLDWAGTTMDYGCYAPAVVFLEVFKRQGVEITMPEAREPMGAHKKDHIRKI